MQSLEQMVNQAKGLELVGSASNGRVAIAELPTSKPETVLLDLNLPEKDGFEVLEFIQSNLAEAFVVILTSYNDKILADKARRNGAAAYMLKDTQPEELVALIMSLEKGKFKSNVLDGEAHSFAEDQQFTAILKLTRTERKLVNGLIKGDSVSGISGQFNISENTVKNHKKNIYRKLKVKTQAELILLCQKHRLLD